MSSQIHTLRDYLISKYKLKLKEPKNIEISLQTPTALNNIGDNDYLDFDNLLGVYLPLEEKIIIYTKGIEHAARSSKLPESHLFTIVLLHEFSHWILHKAHKDKFQEWDIQEYNKLDDKFHELYAQLLTFWFLKQGNYQNICQCMTDLSMRQSSNYQYFDKFYNLQMDFLIDLSFKLRNMKDVTWEDFELLLLQGIEKNPKKGKGINAVYHLFSDKLKNGTEHLGYEFGFWE